MASNTNQSIRESLQRLRNGLQRTIQIFRVYNDATTEDGTSFDQMSCDKASTGEACGSTKKHSQVRFDKRSQYREPRSEEELASLDYENRSVGDSRKKEPQAGPSTRAHQGNSSYIRQRPGENTAVIEQELYSTSTHGRRQHSQKPKARMCQLEEIELPDAIMIQCRLPDDELDSGQKRKRQRGDKSERSSDYDSRWNKGRQRGDDEPREFYDDEPKKGREKKKYVDDQAYEPEEFYENKPTNKKDKREEKPPLNNVDNQTQTGFVENNLLTYFDDGIRRVDFVLVYKETEDNSESASKLEYYLANIEKAGLHLETIHGQIYEDTIFIKLHIPKELAVHLAEVNNISLACKNHHHMHEHRAICPCMDTVLTTPDSEHPVYRRNPESVSGDQPQDPTCAERIMAINEILQAEKFGDEPDEYGLQVLLKERVLITAYPLHEDGWRWTTTGYLSDRQFLKAYWANIFCSIYTKQPIHLVKKYFGSAFGFYFALVGYYIQMLLVPAWVGILVILYGLINLNSKNNRKVWEVCEADAVMCPACKDPDECSYSLLSGSCSYSKWDYEFDNGVTIIYAIILSFWGAIFIIFWTRKENLLRLAWNLNSINADTTVSPAFQKKAKYLRTSPVTGEEEPYMPNLWTCGTITFSCIIVLLIILLIIIATFCIALFRISTTHSFSSSTVTKAADKEVSVILRGDASLQSASLASFIGAIVIVIVESFYSNIADWLTEFETPRTLAEYENSFILKLFILEFATNYSLAFYLAFFRGRAYTYPGDEAMWNGWFGVNGDICDPSGCIVDLCIFITILILVRAIVKFILHVLWPIIFILFTTRMDWLHPSKCAQWEMDYELKPIKNRHLIRLHIDIIIQYGFVVFFVAVFPLLPFLVWLLNVIEMRVNAITFIQLYRRPVPKKIYGISILNRILHIITYIGIVTNAFVIGFTSDFVQREIYKKYGDRKMNDYVNSTLSVFDTTDYSTTQAAQDITTCYYRGKRYPPDEKNKYQLTADYFHELSMRFVLTIVILILVIIFIAILYCIISEIPYSAREELNYQEEKYQERGNRPNR